MTISALSCLGRHFPVSPVLHDHCWILLLELSFCFMFLCSASSSPPSASWHEVGGWMDGWMEEAYLSHVSLLMLYCALGIHVDESGSQEERQSGDGTSFPESPDLSHVGTNRSYSAAGIEPTNACYVSLCSLLSCHVQICSYLTPTFNLIPSSVHFMNYMYCPPPPQPPSQPPWKLTIAADLESSCPAAIVC